MKVVCTVKNVAVPTSNTLDKMPEGVLLGRTGVTCRFLRDGRHVVRFAFDGSVHVFFATDFNLADFYVLPVGCSVLVEQHS